MTAELSSLISLIYYTPQPLSATAIRLTDIKLPLDHDQVALEQAVCERLGVKRAQIKRVEVFRRGYDARKKSDVHFIYTLDVETNDNVGIVSRAKRNKAAAQFVTQSPDTFYKFVTRAKPSVSGRPVVIGTGPCGLFAGLLLAQMGYKPIVLERGKIVRERTKDTWGFWRKGQPLQPESNVQFGEGGAGTFSDGKLWSQVKDPLFHGRKVLMEMVAGGAPEEIMYVSKPHVGTFRLVKVVEYLRTTIESLGGEVRFECKVRDMHVDAGRVQGLTLDSGEQIATQHVVLAIGHSARDTFQMLLDRGVYMEAKPFSVGFRIEHPQGMIDRARLGPFAGHPKLGAADYKLVHHASNGRSVYSFCMCPGGTVVAATSETGRVVTNGMSQYSRNERNANAGIVVGIDPRDYDFDYAGKPLVAANEVGQINAGVRFQRALESRAFELGGGTYDAPGQLIGDFLRNQASKVLGEVEPSYKPGVHLTSLDTSLPRYAIDAIREALPAFGKQIKGFDAADGVLTGVETRTSSPVRIKRYDEGHPLQYQSLHTQGLYPAGEGAGYAGGIMSAAIDGLKVAEAVALAMNEDR
jgi:uncharacterized protein